MQSWYDITKQLKPIGSHASKKRFRYELQNLCGSIKRIPIVTVYKNPDDFKIEGGEVYVARTYIVTHGKIYAGLHVFVADTFDKIRQEIPETMIETNPDVFDDPCIYRVFV